MPVTSARFIGVSSSQENAAWRKRTIAASAGTEQARLLIRRIGAIFRGMISFKQFQGVQIRAVFDGRRRR
jgi:hypothetical protein